LRKNANLNDSMLRMRGHVSALFFAVTWLTDELFLKGKHNGFRHRTTAAGVITNGVYEFYFVSCVNITFNELCCLYNEQNKTYPPLFITYYFLTLAFW